MNSRQLISLGVAALAIIVGAIWIGLARNPSTDASVMLYPTLKGQLTKIQTIKIYQANNDPSVELNRTPNGWSLQQRNGYPADTAKVSALLLSLERATIREEKTSNPDNYATLGVQDSPVADNTPSGTNGTPNARVEISGTDVPVNLIVGKSDTAARGSYVRRAGESKSWLVSEQLNLGTDVASWLRPKIVDIGADRIQEAAVQVAGSPRYNAVKTQRVDANFDVLPLPKNRELNSVGAANAIAQVLVNLQLDDVRPINELADNKAAAHTTLRTFDGLVVDLNGYSIEDQRWITITASIDEALAKRFHLPVTAANPTNAATKNSSMSADSSLETSVASVRAEAEAINKQLGDWAYAIAPYKYDAAFKPVDQMLRKP